MMNTGIGRLIHVVLTVTYGLVAPVVILSGFNGDGDVFHTASGLLTPMIQNRCTGREK